MMLLLFEASAAELLFFLQRSSAFDVSFPFQAFFGLTCGFTSNMLPLLPRRTVSSKSLPGTEEDAAPNAKNFLMSSANQRLQEAFTANGRAPTVVGIFQSHMLHQPYAIINLPWNWRDSFYPLHMCKGLSSLGK